MRSVKTEYTLRRSMKRCQGHQQDGNLIHEEAQYKKKVQKLFTAGAFEDKRMFENSSVLLSLDKKKPERLTGSIRSSSALC